MKNSILFIFSILFFSFYCRAQGKWDSTIIPDYGNTSSWAALPGMMDKADEVPSKTLYNRQDSAEVDVFFIHPTTHLGFKWNQGITGKFQNRVTDYATIQHQASIFNESCRVYAPRYRQATVYSFFMKSELADTALEIAYRDVKRSFEYYLENYNHGRPIVIAGHSQGSRHALQLLKEYFDDKSLGKKLVVAYLPGWVVKCKEFKKIPVCSSELQTGCFVSWNSFVWGADIFNEITKDACCTNPLNWNQDTAYVSREHHLGSVPPAFNKIDEKSVDAKCVNGKLWVHLPADITYFVAGLNYHVLDYNLFYMDVRKNVKERIKNYYSTEKIIQNYR